MWSPQWPWLANVRHIEYNRCHVRRGGEVLPTGEMRRTTKRKLWPFLIRPSTRASRPNPCQPSDVCLIVGEPFASFIAEHHPRRSRWIAPEEAVEILRAEDERGHAHHAFFKDAMLGRFYAICNCCACCCGAMQAHRTGIPMLASSGYVSRVDAGLCVGCGLCADSCQFGALSVDDGTAAVDPIACMGCGVCVSKCAEGALSLVRDPDRGEPLEIRELIASAG